MAQTRSNTPLTDKTNIETMPSRVNALFLMTIVLPSAAAESNDDIPAWEIGLAAGSGAVALFLCLFAVYIYGKDRPAAADIEAGVAAPVSRSRAAAPPVNVTATGPRRSGAPAPRPGAAASRAPPAPPRSAAPRRNSAPGKFASKPQQPPMTRNTPRRVAEAEDAIARGVGGLSLGHIANRTGDLVEKTTSRLASAAGLRAKREAADNPDDARARDMLQLQAARARAARMGPARMSAGSRV